MPNVYKEGNYIPIRAMSNKPPFMFNKLSLRPIGSLQNNIRLTQKIVKSNRIKRLSTKKNVAYFNFVDVSYLWLT